jgi:hypothetical protein
MKSQEQNPEQILRALQTPASSDSIREKARHRALSAFRNQTVPEQSHRRHSWWVYSSASVIGLIVIMLLAIVPRRELRTENIHVFSEVESMFSGRLLAAIKDGDHLDLKLSDSAETHPDDQRILITLRKKTRQIQIVTYSGQPVDLKLDGHTEALTPMLTGDGSVIIVTDHDLIQGTKNTGYEGYSLSAKPIEGGRS